MSAEDTPTDEERVKRFVSSASLEHIWEQVNDGIMSDSLLKQHDTDDDHPVPAGSVKERLAFFMSHWKFEVLIVTLIVVDLLVTLIEMGLEYRFLCMSPELVPLGREQIKGLSVQHAAFTSLDLQDSSNASAPYFSLWPTLQKEAVKGAMMLQVGTSSIAKLVSGTTQPEDIAEGHGVVGESEPDGNIPTQGHGHVQHVKTLICEGPHGKRSHKLHYYCHALGLAILSLFILELVSKAWINFSAFCRSKLQCLDLTIVSISFTLDFIWPIFESRHRELLETRTDLVRVIILFIRLVRVVKVMHATSEVMHKGLHYVKELKKEIHERDDEIEKLKEALKAAQGGKSKKNT